MKVAICSYPMLFQAQGGLQIQVLETKSALNRLGVDASIINPSIDQLVDYDLVHIFSAINGNYRIAEIAKVLGVKVVTSPLIQPHWTKNFGRKARLIERLVGKLTNWDIRTEYHQINSCLNYSDHLIALSEIEREAIKNAFLQPQEKISVIPNGIPERFFLATPDLANEKGYKSGFVLTVASINSHKNQLATIEALKKNKQPVVLIGQSLPGQREYLDRCLAHSHVSYFGRLDYENPLLTSAYAAAGVFCLSSQSEVMPLSILESLAAGTPVVMTKNHCMNLAGMKDVLIEVDPNNRKEINDAILFFLTNPPSIDHCQAAVRKLTWDAVGGAVLDCYRKNFDSEFVL